MTRYEQTIAAISTPPGKGGVAVIRISGADAAAIADKVFFPKNGSIPSSLPPRMTVYGEIRLDGKPVDDGMLTLFRAPASFTGEDTAEISCHGGVLVSMRVLEACFSAGAVPAEAGEFTRRSFINGKMTLSEAEAIGDLLGARTDAQLALARTGIRGTLSRALDELYEQLRTLCAAIYVRVDYPEEDLSPMGENELRDTLTDAGEKLDRLIAGASSVRAITEGIPTVICGTPNTGKSSLYNALSREELAIVTDVEGTTRDTLTTEVSLGRVLLRLSDTAGIRESDDPVERIGVERSRRALDGAELVFCVFDRSRPLSEGDLSLCREVSESGKCAIALINKTDLLPVWDKTVLTPYFSRFAEISAAQGTGLSDLISLVEKLYLTENFDIGSEPLLLNARQCACARLAREAIRAAFDALQSGLPDDVVAFSVEEAMRRLGELDGKNVTEDVISSIFSRFCVGK